MSSSPSPSRVQALALVMGLWLPGAVLSGVREARSQGPRAGVWGAAAGRARGACSVVVLGLRYTALHPASFACILLPIWQASSHIARVEQRRDGAAQ